MNNEETEGTKPLTEKDVTRIVNDILLERDMKKLLIHTEEMSTVVESLSGDIKSMIAIEEELQSRSLFQRIFNR